MKKSSKTGENFRLSGDDNRSPRREPRFRESDINADDSFSEERTIVQGFQAGSWESQQSLDSGRGGQGARPSSRPSPSPADRRKQFDTTTPTLVDEEYERVDDAEIDALEQYRRYHGIGERPDDAKRASATGTPQFKPFGSARGDPASTSAVSQTAGALRKTPGATQKPAVQIRDEEALGFGLMLSTPLDSKGRDNIWQQQERSASVPLVPNTSSQGPFSFSEWESSETPTRHQSRQRAFSPSMLRLSEDLGNLLQDEDDDYALELPGILKGTETLENQDHWTGSYNMLGQRKPFVPRPGSQRSGDRPRRRTHTSESPFSFGTTHHSPPYFANTQQPIPRRVQNEVFEFGEPRNTVSPAQPLIFGGAFVPPPDQVSAFPRPVAAPHVSDAAFQQGRGGLNFAPNSSGDGIPGSESVAATISQQLSQLPPPGYDVKIHSQQPVSLNPPPSTTNMITSSEAFVPSYASTSGAQAAAHWVQPVHPSPIPFGPIGESGPWEGGMNYPFNPNYIYPMQQAFPTGRSSMTPSPHLYSWQDSSMFGVTPSPQLTEDLPYRQLATPSQQLIVSDFDPSQPGSASRPRRDVKRGKRSNKKKSKGKKGRETPRPDSVDAETQASADLVDPKKADLIDSPSTKAAFKEFFKQFRLEEKMSIEKAKQFAASALDSAEMPESIHWRVYLELADLSRRSNEYSEARRLYQKVCQLQPYASQGWLEYSKLEEECGHMNRVTNILHAGLEYCEYSEGLLTKAVKHQEKMGNMKGARELLARLRHLGIDKVWKTVLEGALLEARAGNYSMARRVLKYLMHHVPWYGPLYLEAYKLERDLGNTHFAVEIVERGLSALPKYGPLWFGSFRLCEDLDRLGGDVFLSQTVHMLDRAITSVSRELSWKIHIEAAQIFERFAEVQCNGDLVAFNEYLVPARFRFSMALLTCPLNLRWKILVAAGRMELSAGNAEVTRDLFTKAHEISPEKGRSSTLLELVRLTEYEGNFDLVRSVLCKAFYHFANDWKIWLEGCLFELRQGHHEHALSLCERGLAVHSGTGRLWALLIQLSYSKGLQSQLTSCRQALNAVPKSGEVWCEGSRIHLNPFSKCFDIARARRHLDFGIKFTPQYGDTYVEMLRLEIISQFLFPIAQRVWESTKGTFDNENPVIYLKEVAKTLAIACGIAVEGDYDHKDLIPSIRRELHVDFRDQVEKSEMLISCANADPNYGVLWFHCRTSPTDTARKVVEDATSKVLNVLNENACVYLVALIRLIAVHSIVGQEVKIIVDEANDEDIASERKLDGAMMTMMSIGEIFESLEISDIRQGSDFVMGLIGLYSSSVHDASISERRKILFGTDVLFS